MCSVGGAGLVLLTGCDEEAGEILTPSPILPTRTDEPTKYPATKVMTTSPPPTKTQEITVTPGTENVPKMIDLKLNNDTEFSVPVFGLSEEQNTEITVVRDALQYVARDTYWHNGDLNERMKIQRDFLDFDLPELQFLDGWKDKPFSAPVFSYDEFVVDTVKYDYFVIMMQGIENDQVSGTLLIYQDLKKNGNMVYVDIGYDMVKSAARTIGYRLESALPSISS